MTQAKSGRSKQLAALLPLLQAAFDAEQQKMRALGVEINQLVKLRDGLDGQTMGGDFALHTTGADMRWLAWSQDRKKQINAELAQLMSRREKLRESLKLAFGRREALKKTLDRQMAAERHRI